MPRNPYFSRMEESEHIKDAVQVIWRQRRPILKWSLAVLLLTTILSLGLKNYYKATTTFYPASLDLAKPEQIFGQATKEMEFYGSGQDLDRLLTICQNNEVKDQLIHEFGLYEHYQIDSTQPLSRHKIRKKLSKLLEVNKTKYDAIDLSIEDQDKELAALMTNRARNIVNSFSHAMIVRRLSDIAKTYETSINEKQNLIHSLSDSLGRLRKKYPIYNIDAQTESMANIATEATNALAGEQARYELLKQKKAPKDTLMYLAARIKGLETQIKSINGSDANQAFNLENFSQGVSKVSALLTSLDRLQGQINEDRIRHQHTQNAIASDPHAVITVSVAEVPDYKSRPKRSVLVLGATVISMMALAGYYLLKHYWA